jgi:hypothetical protein
MIFLKKYEMAKNMTILRKENYVLRGKVRRKIKILGIVLKWRVIISPAFCLFSDIPIFSETLLEKREFKTKGNGDLKSENGDLLIYLRSMEVNKRRGGNFEPFIPRIVLPHITE